MIPPAPFLSGGRLGAREGGPGNRRADVDRVTRYLSRVRFCSPSVTVGGARSCRGSDAPLRLVVPGGVGEVMVATTQVNNLSRPLPRPGGFLLRRHRRGRGEPFRSPRSSAYRHLREAAVPTALFVQGARMVVGFVAGCRVDRARASLGDCRQRVSIQDRWSLGRVPGRCSFNDGFDPALVLGSYCGSLKLLCDGAPPDLGGGGCYQRRRGRGMAVAFADEHGA